MKSMKIVVPLDGSVAAEAALPEALERFKDNAGARLVLVRAVDPASLPRGAGSDEQARAFGEAAEYLQKVAARLRSDGVDRVGRAVWFARPGLAIEEAIRTVKPDLIVMSERHGDGDNGPGSIAHFVGRQVPLPVLLVTSPKTRLQTDGSAKRSWSGPPGSLDGPTHRAHGETQDLEGWAGTTLMPAA